MVKIENVLSLNSVISNRLQEITAILEIIDRAITESFDPNYASELDELRFTEFDLIKRAQEMDETLQIIVDQMKQLVEDWKSRKTEAQDRYFTFDEDGEMHQTTKEAYDAATDPDALEETHSIMF